MIKGLDIGNFETKISTRQKFYSRIKPGHQDLNKDEIKIEFEGKKYTIGSSDGVPILGEKRYMSSEYKLFLLTALAISSKDSNIDAEAVISIPPLHYDNKELRKSIKDFYLSLEPSTVVVDGQSKIINIKSIEVFCENSIVYSNPSKYREQNTVSIDVGGGTVDINEFKGLKLIKYTSESLGTLTLYEDIKKAINSKFLCKISAYDVEDLIGKNSYEIKQEKRDITFVQDIIRQHTRKIINVITQNFNVDNSKLELIGGGAKVFLDYFKEEYPGIAIQEDPQFRTAITNEKVGEMLWSAVK